MGRARVGMLETEAFPEFSLREQTSSCAEGVRVMGRRCVGQDFLEDLFPENDFFQCPTGQETIHDHIPCLS